MEDAAWGTWSSIVRQAKEMDAGASSCSPFYSVQDASPFGVVLLSSIKPNQETPSTCLDVYLQDDSRSMLSWGSGSQETLECCLGTPSSLNLEPGLWLPQPLQTLGSVFPTQKPAGLCLPLPLPHAIC